MYYVEGLRLEPPFDVSPCHGASRWRRHSGACSAETVPDASTRAAILAALSGSSDANAGREIVDVRALLDLTRLDLRSGGPPRPLSVGTTRKACVAWRAQVEIGGTCSDAVDGVSAVGATVSFGGDCWHHVHPDEVRWDPTLHAVPWGPTLHMGPHPSRCVYRDRCGVA